MLGKSSTVGILDSESEEARADIYAWREAEVRRCFVATCIAAVRVSGEGEAAEVEYRGCKAERARRECVYAVVASTKRSSYSRESSFMRGGSRPGIWEVVTTGRHSRLGVDFKTTSMSAVEFDKPASSASRNGRYVVRALRSEGRLDAWLAGGSRLWVLRAERRTER